MLNNSMPSTLDASGSCSFRVQDTKVLQRAGMESSRSMPYQLRCTGYVRCTIECHLPKRLIHGELYTGKRSLGSAKKGYSNRLKESLKQGGIPHSIQEGSAEDRAVWPSLVMSGVSCFEENRIRDKEQRCQKRKSRGLRLPA